MEGKKGDDSGLQELIITISQTNQHLTEGENYEN
jgi:hypothetical protein